MLDVERDSGFVAIEVPGKLRIVSRSEASTVSHEVAEPASKPVAVRVAYSPESGKLTTSVDGEEILVHVIGTLVTAPAEIIVTGRLR